MPLTRGKSRRGESRPFADFSASANVIIPPYSVDKPRVQEANMRKTALILIAILGVTSLSGCVPVAIGAAGAIAADTIAEDRGQNLF